MVHSRFFIPNLAFARTRPMMRTKVPSISLACAPIMCSTLTRTAARLVDFVRLLALACLVSGYPRMADGYSCAVDRSDAGSKSQAAPM